MKITLFTSNLRRHFFLINLLSKNCDELFVVQESRNTLINNNSKLKFNYFKNVISAAKSIFTNYENIKEKSNIKLKTIISGEINKYKLTDLSNFLKSDAYIVYGSSYITGDLVNFLIKKKALNIHMGVSPYYRGADCNFWALYDDNPHLVGATIHLLSKGLDSGPVLYHALSNLKKNPFEYTMSTVKSAFYSLAERINNKNIFNIEPKIQNKQKEIRYSKQEEFTDEIVEKFLTKKINLFSKDIDKSLLIEPYFFG